MDNLGNPSLTKLLFAGLLVTFVAATLFSNYLSFAAINNANIEEPYRSAFQGIANEEGNFRGLGATIKEEGLVRSILNLGSSLVTGTVNVFITGLEAMGAFFAMIPFIGNVLSAISLGIPGLAGLMSLLILIIGIYVAMRYITSVSNKNDLP